MDPERVVSQWRECAHRATAHSTGHGHDPLLRERARHGRLHPRADRPVDLLEKVRGVDLAHLHLRLRHRSRERLKGHADRCYPASEWLLGELKNRRPRRPMRRPLDHRARALSTRRAGHPATTYDVSRPKVQPSDECLSALFEQVSDNPTRAEREHKDEL